MATITFSDGFQYVGDAPKVQKVKAKRPPTVQTFKGKNFPQEMRRQLWPNCCGAGIISGFKDVQLLDDNELLAQLKETLKSLPDFQVYEGEQLKPSVDFLTLNWNQARSEKIMKAVTAAGFVCIGSVEARGRGWPQHFYIRDKTKTWKPAV